jgi:hypothetical protein
MTTHHQRAKIARENLAGLWALRDGHATAQTLHHLTGALRSAQLLSRAAATPHERLERAIEQGVSALTAIEQRHANGSAPYAAEPNELQAISLALRVHQARMAGVSVSLG